MLTTLQRMKIVKFPNWRASLIVVRLEAHSQHQVRTLRCLAADWGDRFVPRRLGKTKDSSVQSVSLPRTSSQLGILMRPSPDIISPSSGRAVARAQCISEGGGRIASMTARPDLQYRDNVAGFGGDSEDSAESQDSQDEEVDIEPVAPVAPVHSLPSERREKRAKKSPLPRAVVDELHIVELVKSYWTEGVCNLL